MEMARLDGRLERGVLAAPDGCVLLNTRAGAITCPSYVNNPRSTPAQCVGTAGFPGLLTDASLINGSDLSLAVQHASHQKMPLADAVVALGLVREEDSYAKLAEAGGFEVADLERAVSSELAVRLVPERIARRHFVVPLMVDNRTLTYATSQPFNAQAQRDIACASGSRTRIVAATRSAVLNTPRPLLPEAARTRRAGDPIAFEGCDCREPRRGR